jgi:hypothetical protein
MTFYIWKLDTHLFYTFFFISLCMNKYLIFHYATYNKRKAIIKANKPVASEKAKPNIA